ncbi:MAG: hypothetical protein K6G84_07175 [Lachnospiraceae bacterium]|nr:hypothetical protein [Lachnospiraceae bacterium]
MGSGQDNAIKYEDMKTKYAGFLYPCIKVEIGGKDLSAAKEGVVIYDLDAELSSGFEASVVRFSVTEILDPKTHKYNADIMKNYLVLGASAAVNVGYGGKMEQIFLGFVSKVRFIHEDESPMHAEVTAMDIKGVMMSNAYARQLTAKVYSEAVREIFSGPRYQKIQSAGIFNAQLNIEDTPDKKNSEGNKETADTIEMVDESDYEFVVKAAKKFNYEFFIKNGDVIFRKNDSEKKVRLVLGAGKGIRNFDVSYDIVGLVEQVEARGMNDGDGKLITATEKLTNKLWVGNTVKSLLADSKKVFFDPTIRDKDEASYRAKSVMHNISNRFGYMECECDGIPELLPGCLIRTEGLGAQVDNIFYITGVRHSISDTSGYKTILTGTAASIS